MNVLHNIAAQLSSAWTQSGRSQRIAAVAAAAMCAAVVIGVGVWSAQPEYVPLAGGLAPSDAAEMISRLDAERISYRLNFSGSTVLVPKSDRSRAWIAVGEIAGASSAVDLNLEQSVMDDPTAFRFRMLRKQEEIIARSIMRMKGVAGVTVHISRPEPSPFTRDVRDTTAGVVLELRSGVAFTLEQAASIVSLISHSVEGLAPENVSLLDTSGRILSSAQSGFDRDVAGQLGYRRRLETDLASKAETVLSQMLGPGRAVVRVTADVDFTDIQRTETRFDPDSKVKRSETISSSIGTSTAQNDLGGAGTSSNVDAAAGAPKERITTKSEDITAEFVNSETKDVIHEAAGSIKRLTVAAVVDLETAAEGQTTPAVTREQVESIIKNAVGFDAQRDDQVDVVVSPLVGAVLLPDGLLVQEEKWTHYEQLMRNASLGIASLVALVLGVLILRRLKPVPAVESAAAGLPNESIRLLADLAHEARENPDVLTRVITEWLDDPLEEQEAPSARAAA